MGRLEAWGTEMMYPHYSSAWAWASNTPFRWGKQVASHLGLTRNPLIVRCPRRINDNGGLRSQFTHVSDIGPTILDMVGIPQPTHVDGVEQQPMTGSSFADSLADAGAPERHTQQHFENFGSRAMYKDGWWLSMRMPRIPWRLDPEVLKHFAPGVWKPDEDPVELYYLPDDFSQAADRSASHPEKVKELQSLFWEEAEKYHVKPLLAGFAGFFGILPPIGSHSTSTYHGVVQNIAPGAVPRIYNHSYTISADLHIPDGGAEGVIVPEASHLGGFSLFVQDGKLKHTYAFLGVFEYKQESENELPTGDVTVEMMFKADQPKPATPGQVTLGSTASRSVAAGCITPSRSSSAATPAWMSASTTAWSSTEATPIRRRSRSPGPSRTSCSTSLRTSTTTTSMPCTNTRPSRTLPAGSAARRQRT
jgi:Sulfatase